MPTTAVKRSTKRRFLAVTLIEMLIAIAIVAIVAGVLGMNGLRAWKEQRFLASVEAVADRLDTAQQLMAVHQIDVRVKFEREGKDWFCWLHADGELPRRLRTVMPPKIPLKEVKGIELSSTENADLELYFFALKQKLPQAIIVISSSRGDKRYIFLDGQRRKVRSQLREPLLSDPEDLLRESQALYPEELYEG